MYRWVVLPEQLIYDKVTKIKKGFYKTEKRNFVVHPKFVFNTLDQAVEKYKELYVVR